jgi:hypothetical protein
MSGADWAEVAKWAIYLVVFAAITRRMFKKS